MDLTPSTPSVEFVSLTSDDRQLIRSALRLLASCARSDAADAEHAAQRGHHDEDHRRTCRDEADALRSEAHHAEQLRDYLTEVQS